MHSSFASRCLLRFSVRFGFAFLKSLPESDVLERIFSEILVEDFKIKKKNLTKNAQQLTYGLPQTRLGITQASLVLHSLLLLFVAFGDEFR